MPKLAQVATSLNITLKTPTLIINKKSHSVFMSRFSSDIHFHSRTKTSIFYTKKSSLRKGTLTPTWPLFNHLPTQKSIDILFKNIRFPYISFTYLPFVRSVFIERPLRTHSLIWFSRTKVEYFFPKEINCLLGIKYSQGVLLS